MANEAGITVKKEEDMPEWYTQVILKSEMADYSAVKGCAIIRPLGYAVWQAIMDFFNERIKAIGVENAYFPLFIPESFFHKEANHVEGFAPEVAWIESKEDSEERLAVRPTSETIMYDSYSKWIRSHRDLPLRINQWCNVVRWEVSDVKLFLRSREFLWQEGHCVYATEDQMNAESRLMIEEYAKVAEDLLAIPTIVGLKSRHETFAGAMHTWTIEAFMPDGKALQSGTSHSLGQNFAKAFGINYQSEDDTTQTPWQTSWGFSTRLLGAMVMTHSDNKGLVLPPRAAPTKVVIIPITRKNDHTQTRQVMKAVDELKAELVSKGITAKIDDRDNYSPGFKFAEAELKGTPLRIELGPRDLENNNCIIAKRNTGEKVTVNLDQVTKEVPKLLEAMHQELFSVAKKRLDEQQVKVENFEELREAIAERKLALAPHCGEPACEEAIKGELQATTRCHEVGKDGVSAGTKCVYCENAAKYRIIFSKNY